MMEEQTIQNAKFVGHEGVNEAIKATINGIEMSVPLDPANRHYAEIMRQVEAGTLTIQETEQ